MKALAEYIMRGRTQALLVTLVAASSLMFSWISAAAIALVTLRQGIASGAWLLLWALLPATALVVIFGDSGPLSLLLGTTALALVLRNTVSLLAALLAAVPLGCVTGLLMVVFAPEYLAAIVEAATALFAGWEEQLNAAGSVPEGGIQLVPPTVNQVAGMLGLANAATCVLCLCLARYWQAVLYNPGGFGEEFRGLRLSSTATAALVLAVLGMSALGADYRVWALIFALPWSFVGLALVHARAQRHSSNGWLTTFYVLWLVFDAVKLMVVFMAIADSWFNFRKRWGVMPVSSPVDDHDDGPGPEDDAGPSSSDRRDEKDE